MGDLRARIERRHGGCGQSGEADQVADIGQRPGCAGLGKLIIVELCQILLENAGLLGHDAEQCLQRLALLGIADAIDRRQQLVEPLCVEDHGIVPNSSGPGSSASSSAAGTEASSPARGACAGRNSLSVSCPPRYSLLMSTATTPATFCITAKISLS